VLHEPANRCRARHSAGRSRTPSLTNRGLDRAAGAPCGGPHHQGALVPARPRTPLHGGSCHSRSLRCTPETAMRWCLPSRWNCPPDGTTATTER